MINETPLERIKERARANRERFKKSVKATRSAIERRRRMSKGDRMIAAYKRDNYVNLVITLYTLESWELMIHKPAYDYLVEYDKNYPTFAFVGSLGIT